MLHEKLFQHAADYYRWAEYDCNSSDPAKKLWFAKYDALCILAMETIDHRAFQDWKEMVKAKALQDHLNLAKEQNS